MFLFQVCVCVCVYAVNNRINNDAAELLCASNGIESQSKSEGKPQIIFSVFIIMVFVVGFHLALLPVLELSQLQLH